MDPVDIQSPGDEANLELVSGEPNLADSRARAYIGNRTSDNFLLF